jgi:hypothetical protein
MANTPGIAQPQNGMAGKLAAGGGNDGMGQQINPQHPSDKYRKIYEQAQEGSFSGQDGQMTDEEQFLGSLSPQDRMEYEASTAQDLEDMPMGVTESDIMWDRENQEYKEDDRSWFGKEWDRFKDQLNPPAGKKDSRGFWERGWENFTDDLGITENADEYKQRNTQAEDYNRGIREHNENIMSPEERRGANMKEGLSKLADIWGG